MSVHNLAPPPPDLEAGLDPLLTPQPKPAILGLPLPQTGFYFALLIMAGPGLLLWACVLAAWGGAGSAATAPEPTMSPVAAPPGPKGRLALAQKVAVGVGVVGIAGVGVDQWSRAKRGRPALTNPLQLPLKPASWSIRWPRWLQDGADSGAAQAKVAMPASLAKAGPAGPAEAVPTRQTDRWSLGGSLAGVPGFD